MKEKISQNFSLKNEKIIKKFLLSFLSKKILKEMRLNKKVIII